MYSLKIYVFLSVLVFLSILSLETLGEDLDTDVMVEKAKIQFILKNYDEAARLSESVIKIDPSNIDALLIMAQVNYINGKYTEAKKYFDKIYKAGSSIKRELQRDYGIILKATGDISGARKNLEEYVQDYPGDSVANYHLADVYFREGEKDKAINNLKKVYEKNDGLRVPSAVLLSEVLLSQGRNDEAEKILRNLEKERVSQLSEQILNGLLGRATVMREKYKKLSLEFSVGAGYDSNGIYITDVENQNKYEESSFFSEVFVEMTYNPIISAKKRLYIDINLSRSFYFDNYVSQFDRLFVNPKLGYGFFIDENRNTFLNAGYEYNNIFFSGGERVGFDSFGSYYQSNGVFFELNHKIGRTNGLVRYEFSFDEFFDHNRSGFNHRLMLVSSSLQKNWNLYVGPLFSLSDVRLNFYDYFSVGVIAGFQYKPIKDIVLVFSAGYEHRRFFDNIEDRSDKIALFTTRIEYFLTDKVFFNLLATYLNQDSSLSRFTYNKLISMFNAGFYF